VVIGLLRFSYALAVRNRSIVMTPEARMRLQTGTLRTTVAVMAAIINGAVGA